MTLKVYRRHQCASAHRTYRTWARCAWSRGVDNIHGEGQYAFITRCRKWHASITLSNDLDSLLPMLKWECGGACKGWEKCVWPVEWVESADGVMEEKVLYSAPELAEVTKDFTFKVPDTHTIIRISKEN